MFELGLKFVKFSAVGLSGVGVDFSVTWLVKEKAGWNKYLANSLGFLCAASTNYLLNRVWTFQDSNPEVMIQYTKFVGIAVLGLLLNNLVVYFLHDRRGWGFYTSKIAAILLVTVWNFSANYLWTFS